MQNTAQGFQGRGFPGPIGANKTDYLASCNFKRDALHRANLAIGAIEQRGESSL
jgi:hypothetical protein